MKVYIVFWSDSFDDWDCKKVFSTAEKANEYIKDKNKRSYWVMEMEVE